ncbi:MAG: LptF/LptG family permease [Thermodesulfovibrionia bacterium]|nr:LptF/LptG family permease [Thermodesulfovibrionia bacterium]
MKILSRYFLKEFFKYFFLILIGMTVILLVAEFFDKMDEFYTNKSSIYLVFQYLLLQAPKSLLLVTPVASLLSILFTVGIASKWKETVAIRAAGGSLKKLFSSFLLLGIVISVSVLIFSETLAPLATRKAAWIRNIKILKKSPKITYREGALWLKGLDGSLIRIRDFVENKNKVLKISIFILSPSFEIQKRIEAEEAEWIDNRWKLKNATVFDFNNDTKRHKALIYTGLEEPNIFREEMRKPGEMNFSELYAYYKRLENAGFKNLKYIVELYGKLAYPTVNFVMILFGVALALNARLGGGLRAAGLGLVVIIGYWLVLSISLSLGNTGTVSPALAPWIGPVVFGITGGYMFVRIKE